MQGIQTTNPEFAGLVVAVLPLLAAYASLYVVGPLLRLLGGLRENARTARDNALRQEAAAVCPPFDYPDAGGATGEVTPLCLAEATVAIPGPGDQLRGPDCLCCSSPCLLACGDSLWHALLCAAHIYGPVCGRAPAMSTHSALTVRPDSDPALRCFPTRAATEEYYPGPEQRMLCCKKWACETWRWLQELDAPSAELQGKLRRARAQHRVIDVTREAVVFDSAAERATEQLEADDWDARLSRKRDERGH